MSEIKPAKSILFALILIISQPLLSQDNQDSLFAVWNNTEVEDTSRMRALMNYYAAYSNTNADSFLYYGKELLQFAEEREALEFIASAKNTIGNALLTLGEPDSAYVYYQEAIGLFDEAGVMKGKAGAHINSGIILKGLGRMDEAIEQYDLGIQICSEIGETQFKLNALNNKAVIFLDRGLYDEAIEVFKEIVTEAEASQRGSEAHKGGLVNLGYSLASKGNHVEAVDYFNECIKLIDEFGDSQVNSYVFNFLGNSYAALGQYEEALKYFQRSIDWCDKVGYKSGKAAPLANIADIYISRGDIDGAKELYSEAFAISEETGNLEMAMSSLTKHARLESELGEINSAEPKFSQVLELAQQFEIYDQEAFASIGLGVINSKKGNYSKALSLLNSAKKIGENTGDIEIKTAVNYELSQLYKAMGNNKQALRSYEEYVQFKDSVQRDENRRAVLQQEFRYAYEKQAISDSIEFAKRERIQQLELEKRDANLARQRLGLLAAGGGLFLLVLLAMSYRNGRKRSDKLLHNILPEEVAKELKSKGKAVSKSFNEVTVLFSDFKGFTPLSEKLGAEELVDNLNIFFSKFDEIMECHNIEKIKTIGDAYMAVCGLPLADQNHAANVVLAALDMCDFVNEQKARNEAQGIPAFEIRIGIHSGPVVAGIVGVKKFQYDVWGDTVNTASRMESSGEAGKVNISKSSYELIKDNPSFQIESRGLVGVKGKGKMEMYFVGRAVVQ